MKSHPRCWMATHLVEIYCNVGNPQLFLLVHRSGGFLLEGKHLAWGDLTLVSIYVPVPFRILLIRSNISLCTLLVHIDAPIQVRLCTILLRLLVSIG